MGIGLCGLVVLVVSLSNFDERYVQTHSHETSTTTANRRSSPASAMNSEVMNLGMG